MNRFFPVLKRINERLVLPQPLKYRIMKEIAADLEDTFVVYIKKGLDEDAAKAKALEKIAADDGVIDQLIEVHETPFRKMLRRLSDKMQRRIEIGLWMSLLVIVGVFVTSLLSNSENLAGSHFNWITGALIICMFGISVSKYYEIYIKRDHTFQSIHRGLPLLIFISCMTILTGTLGFFVELQKALFEMAGFGLEEFNDAIVLFIRSFSVISFSFIAAAAGAITWLIMTMKTLNIEDNENEFLHSKAELLYKENCR
ncbi:hypothetical protein ACFL2X_04560 [Candidatus Latescibacterota bacterium]